MQENHCLQGCECFRLLQAASGGFSLASALQPSSASAPGLLSFSCCPGLPVEASALDLDVIQQSDMRCELCGRGKKLSGCMWLSKPGAVRELRAELLCLHGVLLCATLLTRVSGALCSYLAGTPTEAEDTPVKKGQPLGADTSGNLYFRLGSDSGAHAQYSTHAISDS